MLFVYELSLVANVLFTKFWKKNLEVFIAKLDVTDENSHEIWSNEAQKIISLALTS